MAGLIGGDGSIQHRHDRGPLDLDPTRGADEFTRFYRHFERPLLGYLMRVTGSAELAADLAAETFARALESIESFDPERGRLDQWLFGIARNVLGESCRRGRVEAAARARLGMPVLVLDDHAARTIEQLSVGSDFATEALADLPGDQRHAVCARVLAERSYVDIARELQCSEALVRQRVSRGLRTLRQRLASKQ